MKKTKIVIIFAMFALASCVTNKYIFQDQNFKEFEQLKIKAVIKSEHERRSLDITPDYFIGIGEGIYPNKNNFVLGTPRTYVIKERPNFKLEKDYYYSIIDSSVKVILYQWDYLKKEKSDFLEAENYKKKFKVFQTKFEDLKGELIKELGQPTETNIEHNKIKDETFRDDFKWNSKNGLNAYLFMFGNNSNGYRQIRLAIYKD
jgi:hypothetical protein